MPGKLLKMLARWLSLMEIIPGFDLTADFTHSKWALGGFTESFAKEIDPTWNIKLMVVAPGGIQTNFGSNVQLAPRHHAYDTHSSPLNQLLSYMTNPEVQSTFSSPKNCARTLFDVVVGQDQRPLPRRLLMGAETIPLVEADVKIAIGEMQAWKEETIGCSVKID
jgi:NAD(P)-dependent dehydrogenase (short-subunit alcohol dehydrogenase family)